MGGAAAKAAAFALAAFAATVAPAAAASDADRRGAGAAVSTDGGPRPADGTDARASDAGAMSPPPPPAASPATSPAKTEAASGGGAKRPQPSAARVAGPPSESELVPGSRALSLDLGIARAVLGGYAYPRIGASGASDRRFRSHGDGAAFRLLYEHPAMDLDWRLALQGEAPAFLGARATVGVTKSIGPWRNPLVLTRAAAGVELMYAGEGPSAAHAVIPVVVGEAEAALRIDLVENRVSIGPVVALGLRYGLPLGAGYDAAALVRGSLRF